MKLKNRTILAVIIVIGMILMGFETETNTNEVARGGIFSITHFLEKEILKLDGQWEFYWQKLYTPEDFKHDKTPQLEKVPQTWSSYKLEGKKLPLTGYATYRLQIKFPKNEVGTTKAIYMPSVSSAYRLWVNGEEKSKNGIVGKNKDSMKPESVPKVVLFQVNSTRVEFIIQASNFSQRLAGISDSLLIGKPEIIYQFREKRLIYRSMIVMSIVIIGLYHVALFLFRRKEPALIFFGIVCIFVAIRATLLEEGLAAYFLSFLDWEIVQKLQYLGATLGTLFVTLFTYTQFKAEMNRKAKNLITLVMAFYSLFILLTPAIVFTRPIVFLQAMILPILLYLLYVYSVAFIKGREGALLNAIATLVVFLTAVHDTLLFNKIIDSTELASVGLLFFLFTQSIIISKRYSMSFARTEKLSHDLARLNSSLEQQVHERTVELQDTNMELHASNQMLNEAHNSRSRWIRNISHEIATPLTSIRAYARGILDGVIGGDKQYIQIIYDQSLYLSRMLHDLHDMSDMENRQIKFEIKKVDIREYGLKLFEKYYLGIVKNGIIFEFNDLLSQYNGEFLVLMDTIRIEQVIVNLLTNAQRFVKEGGKIVLELDKENEEYITMKVKDNGTGIKEEELELIFDRFYKSRNQGKTHNGSGLGLAISKEIIDYHKGKLLVDSKPGEGSCFYFTLQLVM